MADLEVLPATPPREALAVSASACLLQISLTQNKSRQPAHPISTLRSAARPPLVLPPRVSASLTNAPPSRPSAHICVVSSKSQSPCCRSTGLPHRANHLVSTSLLPTRMQATLQLAIALVFPRLVHHHPPPTFNSSNTIFHPLDFTRHQIDLLRSPQSETEVTAMLRLPPDLRVTVLLPQGRRATTMLPPHPFILTRITRLAA